MSAEGAFFAVRCGCFLCFLFFRTTHSVSPVDLLSLITNDFVVCTKVLTKIARLPRRRMNFLGHRMDRGHPELA